MEEMLLTRPTFVSEFRCIGTACPDTCCKGWDIPLDKATYHKYLNSEHIEIKQIASEHLELLSKSDDQWARIKIHQQENCPFLTSEHLCNIHKKLGPEALSQTCNTYPHIINLRSRGEEQNSLNLSCPEAVRLLLLNADAMKLTDEVIAHPQDNQSLAINDTARLINLFCTHLLLVEQQDIETNLCAIATFLFLVQKVTFLGEIEQNLEQLVVGFEGLKEQLQSGQMNDYLAGIQHDNRLQSELLRWMQNFMYMQPLTRGKIMKDHYLQPLMNLTKNRGSDTNDCIEDLRRTWSDQVKPWLKNHAHVLRNYLLYRCYHDHFPSHPKLPPLQVFYLLMADLFFIKSLIAAKALNERTVNMDDFINVIYSLHTVAYHKKDMEQLLIHKINIMKYADDLSVLKLLL